MGIAAKIDQLISVAATSAVDVFVADILGHDLTSGYSAGIAANALDRSSA
jgi:hypothetical protein